MIYLRLLWALLKHKWFVFQAGKLTKVPLWRRITHDWSKFTPTEFLGYARWHIGESKDKSEWAKAWHHHLRCSPHHPEHWLLSWRGDPDFYQGLGQHVAGFVIVLPMPETYVRELIADCMGAGKTYTGSWDISNWLNENGPKMILHYNTIRWINTVMYELGYFLMDNCDWSWSKV